MDIVIINDYSRLSPRVEDEKRSLEEEGHLVSVLNWDRKLGMVRLLLTLPWHSTQIWRGLNQVVVDALHITHLLLLPVALLWARTHGAKVIYDSYELYGEYSRLLKVLENWLVKRVDGVLTITSVGDVVANRYRKRCENVEVVYNVPYLRDNKVSEGGNHTITFVGKLQRNKGSMIMGPILSLLEEEYADASLKAIYRRPYDEMLDILSRASVGIALHQPDPYFRRVTAGNGRKFFTYMQAGLPIVGPEWGEIGQIVREERCGILCDTTDAGEVAKAIRWLFQNPGEAKEMGMRGRKAVEERYNFDREKEKVLRVYRGITDGA